MRILAAALAASLFVAACSSAPEEQPSPTPTTQSPSPTPSASPTPEAAFPLTGVSTDDPLEDRPVVSVKIENTPSARPQAGLDRADIVYEQIVEGGVTRFTALFHSDLPEEVGPTRSGRLVDVPILEPWYSVLVYSGAREDVTDALARADNIGLLPDSGPPIFTRAPDRPGSHDLMADLTLAVQEADRLDDAAPVPSVPYVFEDEVPDGGVEEPEFEISMSSAATSGWQWDDADDVYRRLQNGEPTVVTGDGEIGAANVVAILTDIGTGGCCDTAGQSFTVTRLEGEGDAVVWRDGERYDVTWSKPSDEDHLAGRRRRALRVRARTDLVPPRVLVGGRAGVRADDVLDGLAHGQRVAVRPDHLISAGRYGRAGPGSTLCATAVHHLPDDP